MRSAAARLLVAGLIIPGVACDNDTPALGTITAAAIVPNPDPGTFAVFTSNSFWLADRARVIGGNLGTRQATSGPHLQPGFEGSLGIDAVADPAWGVYADTLRLEVRAVAGNVYTNGLTHFGATFGVLSPFSTLAAFPAAPTVSPGTAAITVPAGITQVLAPGSYGNVTVFGRLQLPAGTFRLNTLTVSNDGVVEARGVVQVRVQGRLSVLDRADFEIGSGLGLTARSAIYIVRGSNGGSGTPGALPSAAQVTNDATLRGLFFVPSGTFRLGQRSTLTGAVFARDAFLDLDARVTFEDGFTCATSCNDNNPCTTDTCVFAQCNHANVANGTSCNDSTVCNGQELCSAGTCTPGTPLVIDDGNPCTTDACHPTQGVTHQPRPFGTPCPDADLCDGNETCNSSGTCVPGPPPDLDDDNPCTVDSCNAATGVAHTPVSAGTPCADNDVCDGNETCNASGACQAGTPVDPDDSNPCTSDDCDPQSGVQNTPLPSGTSCADSDPCDGNEACSAQAVCLGVAPDPLPDECIDDPPVSTRCGDAIRDPVTEECDDGPGDEDDACTEDCRVQDVPVDPLARVDGERLARTLGFGRHPLATGAHGTLLSYVELDGSTPTLQGALFSANGHPNGILDLGIGARPSQYADASIAAIGSDLFAVVWNDLGNGSLDVGLRLVSPEGSPVLHDPIFANSTLDGAQQDPDVLWTGTELVVAWNSDFVTHARSFDQSLLPLGPEQRLGPTGVFAGSVSLARFGSGWAAAWRETAETGAAELIAVHTATADFTVGPFLPGAPLERPALVELDASNLLVVFTEGTDPLVTGTASVTRLRGAVLNVAAPGAVDAFSLESLVDPYATDETISQARPALARVGVRVFLGWETEGLEGSALSSEVWLQELTWDTTTGVAYGLEIPMQVTVGRDEAQHTPALAVSPLIPEGALTLGFEQHAETSPFRARPDVIFSLRPVPFVILN